MTCRRSELDMHDAMFLAVRELPGGVHGAAQRLGMQPGYLQKCLQKGADTHNISFERAGQLVELMHQLGREDLVDMVVNAFCWRVERTSVQMHANGDEASLMRSLLDVGRRHGELAGGLDDALADGRIDARELRDLENAVMHHIESLTGLLARVRTAAGVGA